MSCLANKVARLRSDNYKRFLFAFVHWRREIGKTENEQSKWRFLLPTYCQIKKAAERRSFVI